MEVRSKVIAGEEQAWGERLFQMILTPYIGSAPDFQNSQPAAQMVKIRNRLSLCTVRITDPQNTKIKCFKSLLRE